MSVAGTVVIVTYNAADTIGGCLDSLADDVKSGFVAVVVVDNESNDSTLDLIQSKYPWVQCIASGGNYGFGSGNNIGIAHSTGEWCFFLNPDAAMLPGCLQELSELICNRSDIGCAAPAIIDERYRVLVSHYPFLNLFISICGALGLSRILPVNRINGKWRIQRKAPISTTEVDRVLGAAMMIPRRGLDEIGGFDERFFLFSEEEDLCFRLRRSGLKTIYHPFAKVKHIGSTSVARQQSIAVAASNWSRYLYLRKHHARWVAELSRFVWIKLIALRLLFSLFLAFDTRRRDKISGYVNSLRSLIHPGYFDRCLRPSGGESSRLENEYN